MWEREIRIEKINWTTPGKGVGQDFRGEKAEAYFWNLHINERDRTLVRMIYEWIGDHTFSSVWRILVILVTSVSYLSFDRRD